MIPSEALAALNLPANEPIKWLFGSVLRAPNLDRDIQSTGLAFLVDGNESRRSYWNDTIEKFRTLLVNPEIAPSKANDELSFTARDFAAALLDFMGEIISIIHLSQVGFSQFRLQLRAPKEATPDYYAILEGEESPVEFKNLRTTRSADNVIREFIIARTGTVRGEGYNIALVNNSDYWLDDDQAGFLRRSLDSLHSLSLPGEYELNLGPDKVVTMRIHSQPGDLRAERYMNFDHPGEGTYLNLLQKAQRVIEEEALIKACMRGDRPRIVVLRWAVPIELFSEQMRIKARLERDLNEFYSRTQVGLSIYVFTEWDHQ